MVSDPSQQSRNGARRKVKITARAAADFHQTADPLDRMWDTQLGGFHMVRKRSVTSWRILYRNTAGKERAITLGRYPAMTADQARKLAHEKLAEIYQGGDPLSARQVARDEAKHREAQTLAAYLEGPYTVYQGRRKKGAETLARIRRDFAAWLAKPMSSLTRTDVDRWQADMEGRGLAFSSLKRSYGALNTMLNVAVERGAIPENPLKGVKLERPALTEEELAEATSARRYLEDQEVVALFAGLEAYQEQKRAERRRSRYHGKPWLPDLDQVPYVDYAVPLISLMFYTGFRPGDLHGLRWEHVNLTFGTIRKVIEKTAHTRPEPQTFPLSPEAVAVLKAWHGQLGDPATGYVFTNTVTAGRYSSTAIGKPWRRIKDHTARLAKKGRIPQALSADLELYTLRHNFASQLIMKGADLLAVSRLMGHADIQTTIEHYGHLAPDHKREFVNRFGRDYQALLGRAESADDQDEAPPAAAT
ncbi:site-specific integrase [Halomonas ramblicola]|uniref:site-specific integrase n=1 Tax=Halomonas ramblicola TaxID=747349 RepID=UPI0025B5C00B|nr:site-specific integrase [Halomonas ramblicola]MDN3521532.1 site-specific integrase [Halomonas ramblicola]